MYDKMFYNFVTLDIEFIVFTLVEKFRQFDVIWYFDSTLLRISADLEDSNVFDETLDTEWLRPVTQFWSYEKFLGFWKFSTQNLKILENL